MVQRIVENSPVVTLEEMKEHLHITSDDFNNSLALNVSSATAAAQAFISRPITKVIDNFSVPFVNQVTLPDDYTRVEKVEVDGVEIPYEILNNVLSVGVNSGERLTYCVVYGYTSQDCPADIKMAIMLMAAGYFNNPVDSVEQLPKASTALLKRHKKYNV